MGAHRTDKRSRLKALWERLHSPASQSFSTFILLIGSAVSKLFGIAREFFMAVIFGTSALTDSWLIASIIPNLLFGLISNTVVNVAVPMLSGHVETPDSHERWDIFLDEAFSWVLVLSVALAVLGEIFAVPILHAIAPGFHGLRYRLALEMTRVMLPTMPFMAVGSLINGIFQSKRMFVPATVTPIIINVCRLFGIIVLGLWLNILGVAIGFLLAQISQAVYLFVILQRQKIRLHWRLSTSHPWTRQSARLSWPFLAAHSANIGGTMVDRIFASLLPVGRIAAMNFSNVLSGLPITLLITPIIEPLYTTLSRTYNQRDLHGYQKSLQKGFELIAEVILPLSLTFVLFRMPIIRILYQHGRFNGFSTDLTAHLLMFWSIGLPAQALSTLLSRGMYAQRVTRLGAWIGIATIGVNVVGDFLLVHPLGASGLALATSLAAWFRLVAYGIWYFSRGDNPVSARSRFVVSQLLSLALLAMVLLGGTSLFRLAVMPFGAVMVALSVFTLVAAYAGYLAVLHVGGVMPDFISRRFARERG